MFIIFVFMTVWSLVYEYLSKIVLLCKFLRQKNVKAYHYMRIL